ncbi:MAG: GNAT family N-acetyltransferase [Acidimicrobiia bacterium]
MTPTGPNFPDRLISHLRAWLGAWPPEEPVHIVGWPGRAERGWDGGVYPLAGVGDGNGVVLSVPPAAAGAVADAARRARSLEALGARLPALVGRPGDHFGRGVFRWSTSPSPLADAGEWVEPSDPRLPAWMAPFNGPVLVAWDEQGRYAAGVGRKRHDDHGQELAVATDTAQRGKGLARRLVAQAARRVLDEGAVPTYLHAPDNVASARVAEAAGFPDVGFSVYGLPAAS